MTDQERELLNQFLGQLTAVRGIAKDPEADALIHRAVAQQPDAAYLLVQKSLLMEQALESAKAQIAQLQSQGQPARESGSFLGDNAWGRHQPSRSASYAPPPAGPMLGGAPNPGAPLGGGFGMGGGRGGSFLGTAAATAAGVVGGAFLFQGIENLLGHHGAAASGLANLGPGGAVPAEATVADVSSWSDSAAALDQPGFDTADDPGFDSGGGDDSTWV